MNQKLIASGKRKTAIAKARITEGNGRVTINKIPYQNLKSMFHVLLIREPLDIAKQTLGDLKFDIEVTIKGGGNESQVEAARLAIAKAIVEFTKSSEVKKAFLEYDRNMLVADTRRKEPYKPGDSKARSKRQKSYR
ncbi:30S ribosomal protein S9 [Candidatus Pacearchaeota archaeon]|nr:30S ribosomal protein S9 [Candidatus Pacearchaeota archaeon]